jgi:glycosyltransferase involved in cell wall biosynthesis
MKIAVIGPKGLPPKQGGIEHYCAEVYPRLAAQGFTIDLYARSSYTGEPWYSQFDFNGIRVISLPSVPVRGIDALTSAGLAIKGYDVIHFHALGPALFSCIPKFLSSAKIVVTCHGLDWQRTKWGKSSSKIIRMGERLAARYANAIIVVSKELATYFQNTYGQEVNYIPTAPASYSGSDPKFQYLHSLGLQPGRYILFLGRLVPEKRPDLLINAFKILQASGWKLVLVGGNSDALAYSARIKESASEEPDIIFTGEQKGKRLSELVRGAGLFVLPSDLEGLPLALLEAMHEGIPVIASDIPPHQQLIASDRGLLFRAGSIKACANALDWAIHNPQEMQDMAETASQHIQRHYNWNSITRQHIEVYQSLSTPISRPRSPVQRFSNRV